MAKLSTPKFLKIETIQELNALEHALAVQVDIESDMVFDELPTTVGEIRRLAEMNDTSLQSALRKAIKTADERMTRLEATQELLLKLQP